jgi:DHA2 family multidrug resistance protein
MNSSAKNPVHLRATDFDMPPRDSAGALNPWIVAVAVMLGTFMEVLDTTVVNVSLPHIAGSVSASVDESTWVLTSYLVANGIVLPLTGWMATYFGRKRLLLSAITGFTIASLCAGLAPTLGSLIFFRVLQGAAGGALQPLSQAILLEIFPEKQRGKAMAFWGLGIVVAPMLGPVLGGWLTDNYSWRWIFYINIPVGIAAYLMTKWFLFDPPYMKRKSASIDYWGIGFLAIGIAALQILLDKGQELDWFGSHLIETLALVSAIAMIAFLVREFRTAHPVVDLRVFANRNYSIGILLMTMLGFVLYGSMVLIPLMLQTLLGYPALNAGLAMLPRGMGAFLMMPVVGVLLSKFEARRLLFIGLILSVVSLISFAQLDLNTGYWDIFSPQLVQGLGIGLMFVPLTTATHDGIPKAEMGNAASLFNLMRNIGGSVGIATTTTLISRQSQGFLHDLIVRISLYNPVAVTRLAMMQRAMRAHGMSSVTAAHEAYVLMFRAVQRQAMMLSFIETFWTLAIIFIGLMPLVFLMKRTKGRSSSALAH